MRTANVYFLREVSCLWLFFLLLRPTMAAALEEVMVVVVFFYRFAQKISRFTVGKMDRN